MFRSISFPKQKLKIVLRAMRLIWELEPLSVAVSSMTLFTEAFLWMYEITLFGSFLDKTIDYIQRTRGFSLFEYLSSASFLALINLVALWILANFLASLREYANARLEVGYRDRMRTKLMAKLSLLNMEDIEHPDLQALLSKTSEYALDKMMDTFWRIRQVISHFIEIVSAAIFVFRVNPYIGFGAVLLVLPEVFYKYMAKKEVRTFIDDSVEKRKYADYVYEQAISLRNFPELKVAGIFSFFIGSREKVVRRLNEGIIRGRFVEHIKGYLYALGDQLMLLGLLVVLVAVAVVKRLTAGELQAVFRYLVNLNDSALLLCGKLSIIGDNAQYIEDYFAFQDFEGFGDISTGEKKITSKVPSIEVVNLSFKYQGGIGRSVEDVSFKVGSGEKVAFVGVDGSGKSTIAYLLCGLYKITKGDILYNGVSIKDLRRGELKDKISALFDSFIRYNMSIRKNILVSEPTLEYDSERYQRVLWVTGLDEWMQEEGISDSQILGKRFKGGIEISAGHWQRIAIARSLYRNRTIFIMDGPFIYIDSFSGEQILKRLLEFVEGRTLVVILQRTEGIANFDHIFCMDRGRIVASGKYEDLLKLEKRYF